MTPDGTAARRTAALRAVLLAVCVASVVVIVRRLPTARWLAEATESARESGATGWLLFGAVYVVAGLAFVPGGALTAAAGAIFGLAAGTAVVSAASTATAAAAFLIARRLLRARFAAWAARRPAFAAVDAAVAAGGWRVVALLRLSPAMPFSAGNYFFGLTAVGFPSYVLASWICMLPGTFLYVYLGKLAAEGVVADGGGRTPAEWALLVGGLAATLVVTAYVGRLAKRAAAATPLGVAAPDAAPPRTRLGVGLPAVAVVLSVAAAWMSCSPLVFGPPPAALNEAYAAQAGSSFDHARFDALLRRRVDADGGVDYAGLASEAAELDAYLETIAKAAFEPLGRDEKLAFLLNAYNAFTLKLIVERRPLASIRDVPAADRWEASRWRLAGETVSLNEIEHGRIRPKFREPRIHFALVCAARGCPPLRAEAYVGARLESQLESQAVAVHASPRWFAFDAAADEVALTKLYDWYGTDFAQVAGDPVAYAARYSAPLAERLRTEGRPKRRWLDYDWSLNAQEGAR